jgi:hypothetical protein
VSSRAQEAASHCVAMVTYIRLWHGHGVLGPIHSADAKAQFLVHHLNAACVSCLQLLKHAAPVRSKSV